MTTLAALRLLTPEFFEERVGARETWAHSCHAVSLAVVKSGLFPARSGARVARGTARRVPSQHSWVVFGDPYGQASPILDLTLWSYDSRQPVVWVGDRRAGVHTPHGAGSIWGWGCPASGGGDPLELDASGLSVEAREFLGIVGPLDGRGWAQLWSGAPVEGWPSRELLEAFLDQHPRHAALVPIDIVGMLTDRNPDGLYMAE